ncbi:MAG: hypothetical protein AAF467_27710 [Actinomycetota bacterium]
MAPQPTTRIANLTKTYATDLWKTLPNYQRRLDNDRVAAYANEMTSGEWQLTGAALVVKINQDGQPVELIDGQHRVKARIEANGCRHQIPVTVLELPEDEIQTLETADGKHIPAVFMVTDTGRPRTWVDFARAMGIPKPVNTSGTIRIGEMTDRNNGYFNPQLRPRPNNQMRYQWWLNADHSLIANAQQLADHTYRKLGLQRPMLSAFFYLACRDVDTDLAVEFTDKVLGRTGTQGPTDPPQAFREAATKWKMSHTSTPQIIQWNTLIRAWHAFLLGEEVQKLWWTPRNLPLKLAPDWWEDSD